MKNLNELAADLRDELTYAMTAQTGKKEEYTRCRNLKLFMRPNEDSAPHVVVKMSISEAVFSLSDFEKTRGSLGPEERYVHRWFDRPGVKDSLQENWVSLVLRRKKQQAGSVHAD